MHRPCLRWLPVTCARVLHNRHMGVTRMSHGCYTNVTPVLRLWSEATAMHRPCLRWLPVTCARVLHKRHTGVTRVLHECHTGITTRGCYLQVGGKEGVAGGLGAVHRLQLLRPHLRYASVTQVLHMCHKCHPGVAKVFQKCYASVTQVLHRCHK